MRLTRAAERLGELSLCSVWILVPYWIGVGFAGACWGHDGGWMLVIVEVSWYVVRYVCVQSAALRVSFQLGANE